MKESALKAILAVVGILALVYAAVALPGRQSPGPEGNEGPVYEALSAVRADSLRAVRVVRGGDTVQLRRTPQGWRVNGYPADSISVAQLEASLEQIEVGELVSRNPRNHRRLGVAGDSAREVELDHGEGPGTRFVLGKRGPYSASGYARLPEDDRVYVLEGLVPNLLRRDVDEWRNKTVARLDTTRLSEVHVERSGERYVLRKGSENWSVDGTPPSEGQIRGLLAQLARLTASGFAPDTAVIEDPARTVTALSARGDTLLQLLVEEAPGEGRYRVTRPGAETVWEISTFRANQVAPTRERLLEGSAPAGS